MISLLFFGEKAILCPNAKVSGVKFFKYLPVKRNQISKWSPLNLKAFLSYIHRIFLDKNYCIRSFIKVYQTSGIHTLDIQTKTWPGGYQHHSTYVPDWTRSQKFSSKLFSQFWQNRFKGNCCQKSAGEITPILGCSKVVNQGVTVKVLYYLHWQTACFTVWANGKQNLGLVDFFPESRLLFVVPFSEKRPGEPERGIKDGFEEMEHKFPIGTFRAGKQDYFFRCSIAS